MDLYTNEKALLKATGFTLQDGKVNVWTKKFQQHSNYIISVDFENKKIDFGSLIKLEGKTTSNFSQAENWVVFECVNRLLDKGYQPQNIVLEKTWATGHGTSGRLDILVTRDNVSYLMIECKTYGIEFEKEFKRLKRDGGQLFTYFQQDKNADVLMLYASKLSDEGKIQYRNEIIKIEDDYRQTGNVKDFYERWSKLSKNNGIFDPWAKLYHFQSKALTPGSLEEIKQTDSGFIFNRFLEILRHNVVSDKPNAFNKIFTLFLCKIYDEKATKPDDELAFQWFYTPYQYEGKNYPPDDNISFQKRLTDLYKKGMKEFLDKEVTDISDTDFEKKYGNLALETKNQILNEFTDLRLKKNNEFAIKEVFDDDSFNENAKVVKEIVELLQGFRIRYTKKQHYLSDFFELLLPTGLKQESGQFFTPVPIAQFIIRSIPLDKISSEKLHKGVTNDLLPTIIDYAAGSGHFIIESMHVIQQIIGKLNPNDFIENTAKKIRSWQTDHFDWAFQYVYGIEKDYRLVKVGKVGCYLHGDGLAQVVHSDGLGSFTKVKEYKGLLKKTDKDFPKENKQFDVVVSNPPYSVSAFKNNAHKYYTGDDFEIYGKLTDQSSEIECLFIERTKQLLKDGGIAGIILPSSILSNTGIYAKAREIILSYFEIVAIVEFGSNTFMATGTNTVVLFLRRRNNYDIINIKTAIQQFCTTLSDAAINGIQNPVAKYIAHVWENITYADYITLLRRLPNEAIKHHETYKDYLKKIAGKNEQEQWGKIISLEQDKLLYFILAHPQKVVLVKSGAKDTEKRFLGYEFSNRRGREGIHPIQRGKSIDECTLMFDAENFTNLEKASTYIYQAFQGKFDEPVHPKLSANIIRQNLADMITFDRVDFEKAISLVVKKKVKIKSKWGLVKIGDVAATQYGYTANADDNGSIRYLRITDITEDGVIKAQDKKFITPDEEARKKYLLTINDIVIARSGSIGRAAIYKGGEEMIFASYLIRLKCDTAKILPDYLFSFTRTATYWNQVSRSSTVLAQPNLNAEKIRDFKIPLPPKEVQEQITTEINALEAKEKQIKNSIQEFRVAISNKATHLFSSYKTQKLGFLCENPVYGANEKAIPGNPSTDYRYIRITDIDDNGYLNSDWQTAENIEEKYVLKDGDFLFARSGATAGKTFLYQSYFGKAIYAGYLIKFETKKDLLLPEFLNIALKSSVYQNWVLGIRKGAAQPNINAQQYSSFEIPLPSLQEQQKIVAQIEQMESQIASLEKELEAIPKQKEEILNKYLY